jgi:KaiC/GvpD/RAD55 family RecA-like ATPase
MTNLETALAYLKKGISIIPLYSPEMIKRRPPKSYTEALQKRLEENAKEGDPVPGDEIERDLLIEYCKRPLVPWTEYQKRLPTEEEVNHWFTMNPDANLGIVTGKVSNLVVFDLDSREATLYAEEEGGFPETAKVKTRKGYHIYMKYPDFEVRNNVNKKLTIDIRGDGGYVAAPPSLHGSGRRYSWEEGYSIFEIDPAPCAPWMLDYLKDLAASKEKPAKEISAAANEKEPEEDQIQKTYSEIIQKGCLQGERNDTAAKLIGHWFKCGMEEKEIWEMARVWNKERNKPPLPESELKRTFESVKKMDSHAEVSKIDVASLLDDEKKISMELSQGSIRIPFAGNNLACLERMMNGGLAGGRFYVFGGIPSSGKTVLLNCITDNICLNGYPVLFFSYDDGRSELLNRSLARFTEHSIEDFNMGSIQGIEGLTNSSPVKEILANKYIAEKPIPVEEWDDLVDQIRKKHNKGPVIIIDYLRRLRTKSKAADERLRVDDIVSKLTDLAKRNNIPVLAISELARDSYKSGQRLSMASFKESGTIEYEASWLGILAAVEEKNGGYEIKENWEKIIEHDGNIDLIVFKAKRGTGTTGRIPLKVDKNKMTVKDRADNNFSSIRSGKISRFGRKE